MLIVIIHITENFKEMPEGPEIHIAARFINNTAKHHRFGGSIDKSEVSTKNPTVEWSAKEYNIRAEARGKELKIHVVDVKNKTSKTHLLLRFGMSGCFKFSDADDMPKHAHLRFYTIISKKKQVRQAVKRHCCPLLLTYWSLTLWFGHGTICPGSSDPFYIASYFLKWVTTSWTHSNCIFFCM